MTLTFLALSVGVYADDAKKVDLLAEVSKITSLQADFTQTNTIKDFGDDIYSGKVYIEMKKKALWDYIDPYLTWYMFSDTVVEQYDEINNQLMRYPITGDSDSVILQVLMDFSSLPNVFDVEQIDNDTIHLQPKQDIGLRYMEIDFAAGIINSISSEDATGNKTKIIFSNVLTNIDIPESVYLKALPDDVEIFDINN